MKRHIILRGGEAEYIEKRSRFIGSIAPATSEEEALAFIGEIRQKHRDARHNVYAYITARGEITRFSDDGEPGGTAGLPALRVFQSEGVTDFCCVITRYFGGILLGSGGLVRAYSKTAKLALDASGLGELLPRLELELTCGYTHYEKLRRLITDLGGQTGSESFGEAVTLSALIPPEMAESLASRARDICAGDVGIKDLGESLYAVPEEK